jgi:hypothetical protein
MSARERERGELPSPNLSLPDRKIGQGLFGLARSTSEIRLFTLTLRVAVNCGAIEEDDCWRDHDSVSRTAKLPGQKVLALTESNKPESARSID